MLKYFNILTDLQAIYNRYLHVVIFYHRLCLYKNNNIYKEYPH